MADDMNSDMQDAATRIGILSQRTTNLETVVGDIRRELNQSITALSNSIGTMSTKVDERFNALSATVAERSRPQWQALSVMLGAMVVLGGLTYWPIREGTSDLKIAVQQISDRMITREEIDFRADRGSEDRKRNEEAIREIRALGVSRGEWSERNLSRDHDIDNIRSSQRAEIDNVQRQLDQIRNDFNTFSASLGNGRDNFADLKQEQGRLRDQLADLMTKMLATNNYSR
jgi:hypothetical protein